MKNVIYKDAAELDIDPGTRPHKITLNGKVYRFIRHLSSMQEWVYVTFYNALYTDIPVHLHGQVAEKLIVFND